MLFSKVVMIMNISDYALIGEEIKNLNVPGMSVSKVQGYGDYVNEFNSFGLCDSLKVEIYTDSIQADIIAAKLSRLANDMTEGGGVIAVEPVAALMNVNKLVSQ